MTRTLSWLCGVACGATGMYFFDARMGSRRRSLVRDQVTRAGHQFANFLNAAGRDQLGTGIGFMAPVVISGRVIVSYDFSVAVYGLLQ